MSKKERIDVLLVEKGFFPSREKARSAIMAGLVFVQEERCDKPGTKVDETVHIRVKGELHPYVSRGGLKLEKAIRSFQLSLHDAVVLDIGSSTGGFTDCSLQNGAKQVYAIDVGYGQLDWKLRSDPRVIVMERTNFRHLQPDQLKGDRPNFATIDVSFISLKIILPVLASFLEPGGNVVALVKPQFEAGRELVGKNGIVREPKTHEQVLMTMVEFASQLGYVVKGLDYSPITGGEGNIEFLMHLQWFNKEHQPEQSITEADIRQLVQMAHASL
ncbi:TlyA family RNA methyltransferase [Ammoniphilus sp. CFH 90114]|uniref:TlyA family RNA methyltransferase n=1 Tax=Ammoniphilus sp. CFH 90114 TaxID=2493665 RepID=UPI00100F00EF|nr:TlyA family RNA methyltransferase [Ammoniphilus sp. CFH 90114]RXT13794.1 TlyA family RNA methyltransferase [Ammoniphilus sp. CFH 90114]